VVGKCQDNITVRTAEVEDEPPLGVMRWLISCDEAGIGGPPYYGFGTLWMPWQRRGDFSALVQRLRKEYGYELAIKWNKVAHSNLGFYKALVEEFFKSSYLVFQCLVIRSKDVALDLHDRDWDLARSRHLAMLLRNKIRRCLKAYPNRTQTFRIWVDPIAANYATEEEAAEVIAKNVLVKVFGKLRPDDSVFTKDSKLTPSIGVCDVLLGAVMEGWEHKSQREAKHELRRWIAEHLGWSDLVHDTFTDEAKFNVWFFFDPLRQKDRTARSLAVTLKYPLRGRAAQSRGDG
jgi:hypothetical protein